MKKRQLVYSSFVLVIVLLLAAVSISAAQQPGPAEPLPAAYQPGESSSPLATYAESEPNNTVATADSFPVGNVISGKMDYVGDVDYFQYTGGQGFLLVDIDAQKDGSTMDSYICKVGEDCNDNSDGLDSLLYVDTSGSRTIQVQDLYNWGGAGYTYKLMIYRPLLVSATVNGTVSGVAFNKSDILAHYDFPGGVEKWMLFFDASDVSITQNINSLSVWDVYYDDEIDFGIQANQPLQGTGQTAKPYDIIWFEATNLGPLTSGSLGISLRGSEEGLTTSGEKIDALAYGPECYSFSTVGMLKIPGFTAQDEDLVELDCESGWSINEALFLDGSSISGLGIEDITAAYFDLGVTPQLLQLVIQGSGKVGGLNVTQKDIFSVNPATNQVLGYYWRGGQHHFPFNLDAIDLSRYN